MQPAVSESAPGNRIRFILIGVLSFAGIVVSAVSLQRHYAKSATEFCDFGQKFNGVLGYAALFFLTTFWKSRPETPNRILAASAAGFCFAFYLTYVEAERLKTWCILCVASQALILLITVVAAVIKLRTVRG